MKRILSLEEIHGDDRPRVGGKAHALRRLADGGFDVPDTLCVTSDVYREFVGTTGLRERMLLELHRKDFKEMRWEEIWDCATRIRNMFLTQGFPEDLYQDLHETLHKHFQSKSVAVRSSAPDEDDVRSSFAGLHESFINLSGAASIVKHIRLVWASLWSDAALLYRQEIGLDVEKSAMAVVVQETIAGDCSGVAFTRDPNNNQQAVIEAVHGLNQGLVDGDIEPDRWLIDRASGEITSHTQPGRKHWFIPSQGGVQRADLPGEKADLPPIDDKQVNTVLSSAIKAEDQFNAPQDVEWTFKNGKLTLLQARPITTLGAETSGDQRGWYLSLHRSFDNLKELRHKIEQEHIPADDQMCRKNWPADLTSTACPQRGTGCNEIRRRWELNQHWVKGLLGRIHTLSHTVCACSASSTTTGCVRRIPTSSSTCSPKPICRA
jgi:phosphoenolpyruvate synthase/pyruvate phosphate dikinase